MSKAQGMLIYFEDMDLVQESLNNPADVGTLLIAVSNYAKTGEIPEFESPVVAVLFNVLRRKIDRNLEKYEEVSQKRKKAGQDGAQKRWNAKEEPADEEQGVIATDATDAIDDNADDSNGKKSDGKIAKIANDGKNSKCYQSIAKIANDGKRCITETETETETETIYTPSNPPPGEGGKCYGGGYSANFEGFWNAYPKKVGKKAAYAIFKRLKVTRKLLDTMLETLKWQKSSADWKKNDGQFIPHPATWLNQGRWEDKPPGMIASAERYAKADEALLNGGNPFDFL